MLSCFFSFFFFARYITSYLILCVTLQATRCSASRRTSIRITCCPWHEASIPPHHPFSKPPSHLSLNLPRNTKLPHNPKLMAMKFKDNSSHLHINSSGLLLPISLSAIVSRRH